jgi:hypothetical protein
VPDQEDLTRDFAFLRNGIHDLPEDKEMASFVGLPMTESELVEIEFNEWLTVPREYKDYHIKYWMT